MKNKKFILNLCINVFLLVLVIIGIILLMVTSSNKNVREYLNVYENKIVDASIIFLVLGFLVATMQIGVIVLSILKKYSSIERILSIFIAGLLALPFSGIFVSLYNYNTLQIIVLAFLLIVYLGNIAYEIYKLLNASKELNDNEDKYFSGLNN